MGSRVTEKSSPEDDLQLLVKSKGGKRLLEQARREAAEEQEKIDRRVALADELLAKGCVFLNGGLRWPS